MEKCRRSTPPDAIPLVIFIFAFVDDLSECAVDMCKICEMCMGSTMFALLSSTIIGKLHFIYMIWGRHGTFLAFRET